MLRILVSPQVHALWAGAIAQRLEGLPHRLIVFDHTQASEDFEIAFLSRDIAGSSAKLTLSADLQAFYRAIRAARSLRWLQLFSAGADRPIYREMLERGVRVTTAAGAGSTVVAHSAIGGMLALARKLPELFRAQQQHRWASLHEEGLPSDLQGRHAVVIGLGPIGQQICRLLKAFELRVTGVRHGCASAADCERTLRYQEIDEALPTADWVFIACPLTDATRHLIDGRRLALLPRGAHLVNVARGDIVDEPSLIDALGSGRLGGAFLDVFAHEPLDAASPLWTMERVIVTPHSASHAEGNSARVADIFLGNLDRWRRGEALRNLLS